MFKEMRRKDRELGEEDINKLLINGEYGVLAMITKDDFPYSIPISYVYLEDAIYVHCAMEGQKLECIEHSNRVCFTIVGQTQVLPEKFSTIYESVVIFGKIYQVCDDEKQLALEGLIDKYSPEFKKEGLEYIQRAHSKTNILKIVVEHISGKGRKA